MFVKACMCLPSRRTVRRFSARASLSIETLRKQLGAVLGAVGEFERSLFRIREIPVCDSVSFWRVCL